MTTRLTKIPGVTIASGSSAPSSTVSRTCTTVHFAPVMASAAKCTVVQVREIVELGAIDPEVVVTPGIFVKRVVKVAATLQKAA